MMPVADMTTDMTMADRLEAYRKWSPFPVHMAIGPDRSLFGDWTIGNDYRTKSGYYGGYPPTYLKRIKAMFPEKRRVLHLFSGMVDFDTFSGDTVDVNADLFPTYVDDAQRLENVPLDTYDLVLADPPYSVEDAEHYRTTMVKRTLVFRALKRLPEGAHVVWLDQVHPQYRKDVFKLEGSIGLTRSTNHRYRKVTIFRRLPHIGGDGP